MGRKRDFKITLYGGYKDMYKILTKIGAGYTTKYTFNNFNGITFTIEPFYGRGSKKRNDLLWDLKGDYMGTSKKILNPEWSIEHV